MKPLTTEIRKILIEEGMERHQGAVDEIVRLVQQKFEDLQTAMANNLGYVYTEEVAEYMNEWIKGNI